MYWRALSSAHQAAPSEQAPMLMRPPSSPLMANLKPWPSSPMRLAAGTLQFSKITCRVGWAFQPIFFSSAPKERPGVSFMTAKAEMPLAPSPPVRANTK